jgi:hypothetical protein
MLGVYVGVDVPGTGVLVRVAVGAFVAAEVGFFVGFTGVTVTIGVKGRNVAEGDGVAVLVGVSVGGAVFEGVGVFEGLGVLVAVGATIVKDASSSWLAASAITVCRPGAESTGPVGVVKIFWNEPSLPTVTCPSRLVSLSQYNRTTSPAGHEIPEAVTSVASPDTPCDGDISK